MISFETYKSECPFVQYENDELLCTARERLDLCTEQFCPMMKEGLSNEEPM